MAIIGTAYVHIRADDKNFESDVRRAAARIKNVTIQLKADVDLAKASKKIRDLRYRITSKDAVLKVDANVEKAEAKMAKLLSKFLDKNIEFNAVANTTAADAQLAALKTRYERNGLAFNANADTTAAEAQLAFAARTRHANIKASVDPQTQAALKGLFNTLTGTIDGAKIKSIITGVAANFESIALKGTALVSILGAASASILDLSASALAIGGDLSQAIGLVALYPAAIGSMITMVTATKMAFKDFGQAFNKDAKKAAEALAKLPPEAQKAVKGIRGLYEQVQQPVQNAFWEKMGTSLQDTVHSLLPDLKKGLAGVGGSMGNLTREALVAFGRLSDGTLKLMLSNVSKFVDNMAPGFGRLIEAFNILGKVGSTYLPQFGTWLGDLGTKFQSFIAEAEKSGKIKEWIEDGTARIQEMGSIVKSTTGIFSGLTEAARNAGAPGLTEMAASMREIRDVVNGEPFQTRLTTVLEGAREGADRMGKAFGDLTKFIGDSSTAIGIFLVQSSTVVAKFFTSVKSLFDGTGLGAGLIEAMDGMGDALDILQPGFSDLGSTIGNLGIISAEVFRGMAPGLNQLFDTMDKVIEAVKQGVIDALPIFNTFIQSLFALAQGPIVALATGIGNLLTGFSKLPGAIQAVIMSLGLFLLLKKGFTNFFGKIGESLHNEKTSAGRAFGDISRGANLMRTGVREAFSTMGTAAKTFGVALSDGVGKSFAPLADRIRNTFKGTGAAFASAASITPYLKEVQTGLENTKNRIGQAFSGMAETVRGKVGDIAKSIGTTIPAIGKIGDAVRTTASGVHANLEPARTAFKALGPAALEAGKVAATNIGAGFKSMGSGLLGALGGGWGVALAGATVALGIFAAEQGKTASKVDALVDSLDKQTGKFTAITKTNVAKELLDLDANSVDHFFRQITGQGRSSTEIMDALGISSQNVVDTITDPKTRSDYVNTWDKISHMQWSSIEDFDKIAGSVGTTGKALKSMNPRELNEMATRVKYAADNAAAAERKFEALAKATGKTSVQAAMLSKNYDTLESSTASVSEKFAALKQNLDIAGDGMSSARTSALDFATSIFDLEDNIKSIGTQYDHWEEGQTKFSESFKKGLLDINGQWNTTSRGAVAFGKQMESARDAVLQSGAAELKRLQDSGKSFPEAAAGALEVMRKGGEQVRTTLQNAGLDAGTVNTIMANLKLNPENLKAAIAIDTQDAEAKLAHLEIFKAAVMSGNWEVALTASSKDVQNTILGTERMREAYKNGGWEAVAKLKDDTGKSMSELMAKIALAKDESEVKVLLKAAFPDSHVFDTAKNAAEEYDKMDVKATLGIDDKATAPAGIARRAIEEYNLTPTLDKYLNGVDLATPVVDGAKGAFREFADGGPVTKEIKGIDSTMGARESAMANMDVPDTTAFLFGVDQTAPGRDAAQITLGGLQDITRSLFGSDQASPGVVAAQATMNGLQNVARWLEAINQAKTGKDAAQATIDLLTGKEVTLSADDQASGVVDRVNQKGIADKSFNIIGILSGVSQTVRNFLGMAHGGIMHNGVQTFANGGMLDSARNAGVKAYANGGIERHTAQIAYKTPAVPMRIWAEAEGGEAYIPLALGKRKRSLEILRRVMAEFGLQKYAMFADGGFHNAQIPSVIASQYASSAPQSSQVAGPASAGSVVNFIVNPSQGLSEQQIGEAAMRDLYWQIASR